MFFPKVREVRRSANLVNYFAFAFEERPTIIHIGAHYGEEFASYSSWGFNNRIWVEPVQMFIKNLKKNVGSDLVIQKAIVGHNGKVSINISRDEVSSSIFDFSPNNPFPDMKMVSSVEVDAITLDNLLMESKSMGSEKFVIVLDTQGSELQCLESLKRKSTKLIQAFIVETSTIPIYAGGASKKEIDKCLNRKGFINILSANRPPTFHGDSLYINRSLLLSNPRALMKLLLLNAISHYSWKKFETLNKVRVSKK